MGLFTFKWDHPADEVFVTGTFDNWAKTEQLEKSGQGYAKTVQIPHATDKIYYKFVVDGQWTTDHTAASETDSTGNLNNVLHPHDIRDALETPGDNIPGGFPISPDLNRSANNNQSSSSFFGVNPLPATAGSGNPISLAPGEKVPHSSSFTSNTVNNNVRLDKESYEKSDAGPPVLPPVLNKQAEANGASMFDLPPVGGTMIPESSLPMGGGATNPSGLNNTPFISSVAPDSSTAQLAGQAPIEPRGVPVVVADSQKAAQADPEASTSSQAVQQKDRIENELKQTVQPAPSTSESGLLGKSGNSAGGVSGMVTGSVAAAGSAIAGAAIAAHHKTTEGKGSLPASIRNSIDKINGNNNSTVPTTSNAGVPSMVTNSQRQAHVDPEAAGSAEAVREKSAMERELRNEVHLAEPINGAASSSLTATSAVPAVVADSQRRAHVSPEAASSAEAVREKSSVERQLKEEVTPALASSNITDSSAGQSAATAVPSVVSESQKLAHASPEAAASSKAVREKSAMEQELERKVAPVQELGEPAPSDSAALSATAPGGTRNRPGSELPSALKTSLANSDPGSPVRSPGGTSTKKVRVQSMATYADAALRSESDTPQKSKMVKEMEQSKLKGVKELKEPKERRKGFFGRLKQKFKS